MKPLLILRPEPGASETVTAARSLGLDAYAFPLFAIEPVAWTVDRRTPYDAIFVTSANAIRHAGPRLAELRDHILLAVGPATADAARAAGFTDIVTGSSDGMALADLAAALGHEHLLHLAGDPHKPIDHPTLRFDVKIVYQSVEMAAVDELRERLSKPCVALVHSPRAARRLGALTDPADRAAIEIVAISAAAATAAGDGWAGLYWPSAPSSAAMLERALPLCRAG